jgi:hypothetical protein
VGEAYPDIVAVDEVGKEARIEVEFESANFERDTWTRWTNAIQWFAGETHGDGQRSNQ